MGAAGLALLLALVALLARDPGLAEDAGLAGQRAAATLAEKLQVVSAIAQHRRTQATQRPGARTSKLGLEDEGGDSNVAVAAAVKDAVGDRSAEGQNLADADYGTPDDLAAVEAVQEAVKAGADAEVDDAVAASKTAAVNDYVATKADFMEKEAAEPNGGVGSIIAMEGEPGHPVNYARGAGPKPLGARQQLAHRAPDASLTKTKLVARPAASFEVRVPAGLKAGEQFLADVAEGGQMLVTVPKGAAGGQVVEIEARVAVQRARAHAAVAGVALRAGVLQSEIQQLAHPAQGLPRAEGKLIQEAEREIARSRDRRAKARRTDSNASDLSADRGGEFAS